ncbi:MAG: hypothetical protein R3B84_12820 [Zavarzinella sp.]
MKELLDGNKKNPISEELTEAIRNVKYGDAYEIDLGSNAADNCFGEPLTKAKPVYCIRDSKILESQVNILFITYFRSEEECKTAENEMITVKREKLSDDSNSERTKQFLATTTITRDKQKIEVAAIQLLGT